MVLIHHDWDTEDYEATLKAAWHEYRTACYGQARLSATQEREVRQAFWSGVHWINCRDDHCPDDLQAALRKLLLVRGK